MRFSANHPQGTAEGNDAVWCLDQTQLMSKPCQCSLENTSSCKKQLLNHQSIPSPQARHSKAPGLTKFQIYASCSQTLQ